MSCAHSLPVKTSKFFFDFFNIDSLSDMINWCLSGVNIMKCYFHTHFNQTSPKGQWRLEMYWVQLRCDFNSCVIQYLVVAFEAADHAGDLVDQAKVMD